MLSRKQWEWAAIHYKQIRYASIALMVIGALVYAGLVWKTLWDKGKTNQPIPFIPDTRFSEAYKCKERIKENYAISGRIGGNPPDPDFREDASLFLLQRHSTFMFEKDILEKYPDCVGAMLSENMNDPNPFVIILYDRVNKKPTYRIEHVD